MKHAILDRHGYVATFGEFDEVRNGMVEIPDDKASLALKYKVRCVNGEFSVTSKPALPPIPYLTWDGAIGEWIDSRTDDQKWSAVRAERAKRLDATDWTTLPDVPMSQELRDQWTGYRQALRDVTDQPDPLNITWPVQPSN